MMPEKETGFKRTDKFSLVELLMIIMLVGLVFVIWIPMKDAKIYKAKMQEAITTIDKIAKVDIEFKNNIEESDGEFAFDIIQLNMKLDSENFVFSVTDTTVVATTTEAFGKKGIDIIYYLPTGPYQVLNDSKKIIDNSWLP
jgi:Tfp pilus assembly protein PilE